jgi:hypothetical protein
MILTGKKTTLLVENTVRACTNFLKQKPTVIGLRTREGLRFDRPASNRQSQGTVRTG